MSSIQGSSSSDSFSILYDVCETILSQEQDRGREFPDIPDFDEDAAELAGWMSKEPAFQNLKGVKLSDLDLEEVPDQLFDWKSLEWIALSGNQLSTLSARVANLVNLKEFRCANNQLKTVPAELFALPKLTIVDLSHNQLEDLPSGLDTITRVFTLKVDGNENLKPFPQIESVANMPTFHIHKYGCSLLNPYFS
jgi:hypothetical protein